MSPSKSTTAGLHAVEGENGPNEKEKKYQYETHDRERADGAAIQFTQLDRWI